MTTVPDAMQSADRLRQVDMNTSIVNQDIVHLKVGLFCRLFLVEFDKCIAERLARLSISDDLATVRTLRMALGGGDKKEEEYLWILPNRLKMSSKSSSRVIGFNLHTKMTFSGGFTSAKGKSPTISSVNACARASAS